MLMVGVFGSESYPSSCSIIKIIVVAVYDTLLTSYTQNAPGCGSRRDIVTDIPTDLALRIRRFDHVLI